MALCINTGMPLALSTLLLPTELGNATELLEDYHVWYLDKPKPLASMYRVLKSSPVWFFCLFWKWTRLDCFGKPGSGSWTA